MIIWFSIGAVIGAGIGFMVAAFLVAAGEDERR